MQKSIRIIVMFIRIALINGMCLFGVGGARSRPHRAPSLYDTSNLTLDLLAALRLEVTSSNLHKTCISTP